MKTNATLSFQLLEAKELTNWLSVYTLEDLLSYLEDDDEQAINHLDDIIEVNGWSTDDTGTTFAIDKDGRKLFLSDTGYHISTPA